MYYMLIILILPFLASFVGFYLGRRSEKLRDAFNVMFTAIEFLLVIMLFPELKNGSIEYSVPNIMGTGIHLKVDLLRYAMLFITTLVWLLTTMYSTQYLIKYKNRNRYYLFFMLTLATTVGMFMSANMLNLFTFFEGLSFTSYLLVIHDEDQYSHDAGKSYLSMSIAGGMVMLFGIFIAFDYTGTLELAEMGVELSKLGGEKYIIAVLIMFGFLIKASVFPLHTWLPKAHPAAPAPASAILSGILVKTGIFGLIIVVTEIFPFDYSISMVLYLLGIINILFGGALALMQRNIKRILAYSSMSQLGFMLMGVGLVGILGEEGGLALAGTILYMINHASIKVLLFLGAGIIYMVLGELSINFIKGFGREKTVLKSVFLIAILGQSGVPGFSGYVSKTMLHEAILEASHLTHNPLFRVSEVLFVIGGGLTVAYMTKLFYAIFVEKNEKFYGQYKSHISKRALIPMSVLALMIVLIGVFPNGLVNQLLGYSESIGLHIPLEIHYFSRTAIGYSLLSILIGILIYFVIVRRILIVKTTEGQQYINPSQHWINLDDHVYGPVLSGTYKVMTVLFKALDNILIHSVSYTTKLIRWVSELDRIAVPKFEWRKLSVKQSFDKAIANGFDEASAKIMSQKSTYASKTSGEVTKIKFVFSGVFDKASTVTASIFLIGIVLVFSFLFVFITH
ncbi:MAG: complex I subunit 5 family protein [Clostridiales bacterium]|nr:complex I subunit 5 family protein [Clostridiales bacterium]